MWNMLASLGLRLKQQCYFLTSVFFCKINFIKTYEIGINAKS